MTVEQGPVALAKLLYQPPEWLLPVIPFVVVGVLGVAALGYHRSGIDEKTLVEISENVFIFVGVLAGVHLFVTQLDAPYWIDVLGGWTLGVAAAKSVVWIATRGDEWRDRADS